MSGSARAASTTILFTALVNSTELIQRVGDDPISLCWPQYPWPMTLVSVDRRVEASPTLPLDRQRSLT